MIYHNPGKPGPLKSRKQTIPNRIYAVPHKIEAILSTIRKSAVIPTAFQEKTWQILVKIG